MIDYAKIDDFVGSDWKYIDNDCFAVFRKASKAVFGRDIEAVSLPEVSTLKGNIKAFISELNGGKWQKVTTPKAGDAIFFFDGKDRPMHIGLYIENGDVLHCPGTTKKPGRTICENLREINRFVYRRFEYYRPC